MRNRWLPEITKRSERGPFMKTSDFDMAIAKRVPELVRKYEIKYDPQVIIPADDDLADRIYQAGLELFVEMGAYNIDTERRILFSRREVKDTVAMAACGFTLGTGKDAVVMRHRGVESTVPPIIQSGPTGTPCTEKNHELVIHSCVREPLVDCVGLGSVSTYMGEEFSPNTPMEILAVKRDAALGRDVLRKAGRPGMHIYDLPTPLSCSGKLAAIDYEQGMRPTDGLIVAQMVELKTDYDQLARVAHYNSIDLHPVDLLCPMLGGLAGGPEGTAIVTVASHILGTMLYAPSYHIFGTMSLLKSCNSDRMGLWIYAAAGQALSRNTPILTTLTTYTANGLGTVNALWEVAAGSLAATVSGLHHLGTSCRGGSIADHTSGIENRLDAEVAYAALGMTREEANDYILEFINKYEASHADPDPGKTIDLVYNRDTVEPLDEWLDCYEEVRNGIGKMGMDIENAWRKRNFAR